MQYEIKKAALGATRAAANSATSNMFSLASLPKFRVELKIKENISIHSSSDDLVSEIKKANTFINPKHESNIQNGYSNWQTSATIKTYQYNENGSISVPRGFLPELLELCKEHNIVPVIEDFRAENSVIFPELKKITLRHYQVRAVDQAMQSDQGVIISPTGSGKSLIGLEIIRRRQQKALIIVHRAELAKQWLNVINDLMGLKAGFIGDGEWTIGDQITLGLVQTLAARENETRGLSNAFGLVIAEECHHCPCDQFYSVLGLLTSKFMYGLSATVGRRDGLEQMIYRAVGPSIANISKQEVENIGATVPATVITIPTNFNPGIVDSWNEFLENLTISTQRNLLIIDLAQKSDGAILILVDRIAHAEQLSEMLNRRNIDHVLAHGKIPKKDRENVMERIKSAKLTIGTTSLLGEGLDVSVWGTLIMGSPISSEIKLLQAIGRIVRPGTGKEKAFVYDLRDDCGFAGSSFKKRFDIYKKHKIWVEFQK